MNNQKLPILFWVIAVAALLWNLMGVFSFFAHTMISDDALAKLPEAEQALYAAAPMWQKVAFAIAVFTGLFGSIGLLMRKIWAPPLFLFCLLSVALQMGYELVGTAAIEVRGPEAAVMPILVILIAAYLLHYSRQCRAKGWLS